MDNKKLKVALVVGELPTTTFINRLAVGLAKANVEVTLFGLIKKKFKIPNGVQISGAKDGFKEGRFSRFRMFIKYSLLLIIYQPKQKRIVDHWLTKNKNKNQWREKSAIYPMIWSQPDIIHVQWAKGIDKFMWVQELGIKLVVSLRGAHINYSPYTVPNLAETYQKCFPQVDGFHGVSQAICLEAQKFGAVPNRCHVVYSGFDLSQFDKLNWSTKNQGKTLNIISIGRSHWKKGYHFALDAMKSLKNEKVPFQYQVIGAIDDEELLFQKNQLELNDVVTFLDRVPFHEVKKMIAQADVLLLPSVEEGIANVVLEAMFLGTLVITTNCGGMVESVQHGHSGWVVPVRDSEAIAEAVKTVAAMPVEQRQQMVEQAYQKVCKQHNEDKMVADMLELYKRCHRNG